MDYDLCPLSIIVCHFSFSHFPDVFQLSIYSDQDIGIAVEQGQIQLLGLGGAKSLCEGQKSSFARALKKYF